MQSMVKVGLLAALAVPAGASAALIAEDGFESYSIGNLEDGDGVVPAGGSGNWNGTWDVLNTDRSAVQVVSRSMMYSNGSVTVNGGARALRLTPSNDASSAIYVSRLFQSQGSSGPVYLSFLLENPTVENPTDDFFQVGLDSSVVNPRTSTGIADNSSDAPRLFARTTTSSSTTTFGASNIDASTIYLVVMKISDGPTTGSNFDLVEVFVNPSSTVEGAPSFARSGSSGINSVAALIFRTARHEGGDSYYVDQIRIASTFEQAVIPEPASFGLLAGAGLLLRRRRC